ncbi:MAG: MBL fold metallo-hydrolase [Scytolyngbya sp. HA4215-MV1]|jgi:flavorubredoxin|nr:MBL fold metallo-hydrolase [Scytolyngbya sp. HA4215-MV1]
MSITEIAPNLYRISTYVPNINLQFNQFLVLDDEPLLFHSGMKAMFPLVQDAVQSVVDPTKIRWVGFSHFEADECGALNEWLQLAPAATPVCSMLGAMVSVNDFAIRAAHGMTDGEVLHTGKYRFRFLQTPHVPHCWEAGLLFEETQGTLFCSDLFHQNGNVEPLTQSDVLDRVRQTLIEYQAGPLANYIPYTQHTDAILQRLADLQPHTIATMHGSAFAGDGEQAIRDLAIVLREVLGQ